MASLNLVAWHQLRNCAASFAAGIVASLLIVCTLQSKRKRHSAMLALDERSTSNGVTESSNAGIVTSSPPKVVKKVVAKLDYIDRFLKYDCGPTLLEMGLFPNSKEITESMACLQAMDKYLNLSFSEVGTLCLVVGDGATPRTAALIAARTKWRRVLSIDPALRGLPLPSCQNLPEIKSPTGSTPTGHAHPSCAPSESRTKGRMRERLKRIGEIRGLELVPSAVSEVQLHLQPGEYKFVVLVLPHAHVLADVALGSLYLEESAVEKGDVPQIVVVQLPCCSFEKHNHICGMPPNEEYIDERICGFASTVRLWRDVTPAALAAQALHVGNRPIMTHRHVSQRVRSEAARSKAVKQFTEMQPAALSKQTLFHVQG